MHEDFWRKRLEEVLGPEGVSSGTDWFRERAWEGPRPQAIAAPATCEQVSEVLRLACAERLKVAPVGHGTKQRLGGIPPGIDLALSLGRLNRITDYPASDLTISVEAGISLRDLGAALAAQGQMLPLDVPFADQATVGGAIATNASGPRRLAYGTWRDFLLGVHFVTADGKRAKGGGKVVKNVAGYDLPKLLIGSFGTLGVITQVALKVFPKPPASATFVLGFATLEQALQAGRQILNSPLIPQALDLVDSPAGALAENAEALAAPYSLVIGVAGPEVVVERFQRELPSLVRAHGLESVLCREGAQEVALWNALQELTPAFLHVHPEGVVVKASLVLNRMGDYIAKTRQIASVQGLSAAILARAGSGIVYSYVWPASELGSAAPADRLAQASELLLQEADRLGGRAIIEWCPTDLKSKINLWGPLKDDFPWMRRLKAELDPLGILNPGRFYGGI